MGSGALIRDRLGRVLVVEPAYKDTWEVPGGVVEADESPRAACVRELAEELGHPREVGRLLCMEWQGPEPDRTESIMFVYDAGVILDTSIITLPPEELRSFRFVEAQDLDALLPPRLARRLHASLKALQDGSVVEMHDGIIVSPPSGR